jgi:hypothetical protein
MDRTHSKSGSETMNAARIVGLGRIGRNGMLAMLVLMLGGSRAWSMDVAVFSNATPFPNAMGYGQPANLLPAAPQQYVPQSYPAQQFGPQQAAPQPAYPTAQADPSAANNGQGPGFDYYGNKIFSPQQARAMGMLNAVDQSGSGNLGTWVSMIERQRDREANTQQAALGASGGYGGGGYGGGGSSAGITQNFGYGVGTGYPQGNPYGGGLPGPIDLDNGDAAPWRNDLERQNYKTVQHAMELDSARSFFEARMVNRAFRDAEAHPYVNPPLPHKVEYTLPTVSQLDPNTGDIHWPDVLSAPLFAKDRQQLQDLFHDWIAGVATPEPIDTEVRLATNAMHNDLKQDISHLDEADFATGSHFIDSLLYAAHQPKPVSYAPQVATASQARVQQVSNPRQ